MPLRLRTAYRASCSRGHRGWGRRRKASHLPPVDANLEFDSSVRSGNNVSADGETSEPTVADLAYLIAEGVRDVELCGVDEDCGRPDCTPFLVAYSELMTTKGYGQGPMPTLCSRSL